MYDKSHLPYSKKGLEDLAVALGIDSAYLWVNPQSQRLDIKHISHTPNQATLQPDVEELEEDE